MTSLPQFTDGDLSIHVSDSGEKVWLRWTGEVNSRDPQLVLTPFLRSVVSVVIGRGLIVDFRNLSFMNSAAVVPILEFVRALDSHKIDSTLIYDTKVDWQKIGMQSMSIICRKMPNIRINDNTL